MSPEEMRAKRAEILKAAKALRDKAKAEKRDLTDEETAEIEQALAEADTLKADAEKAEAKAKTAARLDSAVGSLENSLGRRTAPETPPETGASREFSEVELVTRIPHGKLKAFVGPDGHARPQDEMAAYHIGQAFAAALGNMGVLDADLPAVVRAKRFCADKGMDLRGLLDADYSPARPEATAQSGENFTYGGASVVTEFSTRLIRLVEEYGVIRKVMARTPGAIVPMSSADQTMLRRKSGLTAYFTGDAAATTQSRAGFNRVNLTAKEMSTLTLVPISLLEDSPINWADFITLEGALAFATKEDQCAIDGDGGSTYGGIVGIRSKMVDGDHAGSYDDATAGDDQWGEYIFDDFEELVGKTPAYPGAQEVWLCSKICKAQTFDRLIRAAGGATGQDRSRGSYPQFIGHDVVISQAMPKATTAYNETVVALFGDVGLACTIGDRKGVTLARSEHRYFEYRQVGFLLSKRFAFNAHDLGDASSAGPLVGLRGNTS